MDIDDPVDALFPEQCQTHRMTATPASVSRASRREDHTRTRDRGKAGTVIRAHSSVGVVCPVADQTLLGFLGQVASLWGYMARY